MCEIFVRTWLFGRFQNIFGSNCNDPHIVHGYESSIWIQAHKLNARDDKMHSIAFHITPYLSSVFVFSSLPLSLRIWYFMRDREVVVMAYTIPYIVKEG